MYKLLILHKRHVLLARENCIDTNVRHIFFVKLFNGITFKINNAHYLVDSMLHFGMNLNYDW